MYPKTIEFDKSVELYLPQIISEIPITKNVENHCSDVMLLGSKLVLFFGSGSHYITI